MSQDKDSCHSRGTRDAIWVQDQPWLFPTPLAPEARAGPVPTDHLSIYTHSLLLLLYRKMSPWSRRLMSSAESWSSPAPKSMTLKQPWNWPRKFNHKTFQRQVMSPVVKKDGHWDRGTNGSREQVSLWLSKLPLLSFLLYQRTSSPWPPGHLCMPRACSSKDLWGPYHIQTLANPEFLGLAKVSEFRIFQIIGRTYYIYCLGQCPEIKHISISVVKHMNIRTKLHEFKNAFHF